MSIIDEIKNGENRRMEFKVILPESSKVSNTVIAYANGAGGKLIIGIKDSGEIKGITDEDVIDLPDRISNIIYDTCYPAIVPEIYIENIEGKKLLVIEVFPGSSKPYYVKKEGKLKGTYIRVGATNKPADEEMIMELERQKRNISFDEELLYDYEIKDVDFEKLKVDFYKYTNINITDEDLKNLKLIVDENAGIFVTKAAVLIAGKRQYFEFARIKCARFKGKDMNEFIDQKEFEGSLYEQVESAMKFAKTHINKKGIIMDLQRQDEYDIPLVAIREAITNAIVHRDYSISGSDIKFAIFDDRIEITSPGLLPRSLDISDIKMGRSEIRNKVIARFFKEIRFIEEWGTGIRRIIDFCKKAGLREPDFIETGMFFKVVLYRKSVEKVAISSDKVAISSCRIILNENEKRVIDYLAINKSINNKATRELLEISSSGARKVLSRLVREGIVVSVGENKSRFYVEKNH